MAEDKKGFLLYADMIHVVKKLVLKDRENGTNYAGELFLHVLEYVNDLDPMPVDFIVEMAFEPIKQQLKRDLKKYEVRAERSRLNGQKGGRPKKPEETQKTQRVILEPKKPDTDNVNDNGNDTDNVTDTDIPLKKETKLLCSITHVNELDNNIDKITFSFWQLFKSNLIEAGVTKTTTLDKATLEKWRAPIRLAMKEDGRTRDEFEEIWNFLKKNEFWKKNIQSTAKLREKFERLLVEARATPTKKNNQPQLSEEYKARLAEKLRS